MEKEHISIDDSFEESILVEGTPNIIHPSTITQIKLKPLFDALNKNFFNGLFKLSGDIKWSDYLNSRTAAALSGSISTGGRKQFIRMSKPLLKNCTRKQLIESLMYEMIFAYMKNNFDDNGDDNDPIYFQMILKDAMDYANSVSGMHLLLNYPFSAHKTIEANSQWIDVDGDGLSVLQNNNTIVCISDDESDGLDEPNKLVDIRRNDCTEIHFVSYKFDSNNHSNSLRMYLFTKLTFVEYFRGTNFEPISNDKDSVKCPLCCQIVQPKALNLHFNDCDLFRS